MMACAAEPFDKTTVQPVSVVAICMGIGASPRLRQGKFRSASWRSPCDLTRKKRGGTWTRSWFSMSTERRRADASAPDRVQPPDSFNRGVAGVVGPVQCANARTDNHIRSRHRPRSNAPATAPPRCGPSCWGGSGRNSRPLPQPSRSGLRTSSVGSSPPSRL